MSMAKIHEHLGSVLPVLWLRDHHVHVLLIASWYIHTQLLKYTGSYQCQVSGNASASHALIIQGGSIVKQS